MQLFSPLVLPSGLTLSNRIVKAAMEENMANAQQLPDEAIFRLYNAWAQGGVGTIITGNVMIDPLAMTGPAGIALYAGVDLSSFKKWAGIAKAKDAKIIMQINNPGRQVYKKMGGKVLSPSDVALNLGKHSSMFTQPKAMTEDDIEDTIERFTTTALLAQKAGFDGVEVHAAHGYLLSQFLSPLVNKRTDQWGGDLANRSRILITIIERIKQVVKPEFSVSVKLNSADFQRGGFDITDATALCQVLDTKGLDFIELSGGSYEAPAMQGRTADERTLAREAYFLEFAEKIAEQVNTPIMTTGGVRRAEVAENVITNKVDLVGVASAMAYQPDLPKQWQLNNEFVGFLPKVKWKNKTFAALATMALVRRQLQRLGKGKMPNPNNSPFFSLVRDQLRIAKLTKRYRKHVLARHVN
jgi:2,4-dienoyl-CoA reductase-like NADH-dependent reductase (Old Yellow Enzyme family)